MADFRVPVALVACAHVPAHAETFYGVATHVAVDPDLARHLPDLHNQSHGQSFIALLEDRCADVGVYLMDETESAPSFDGQLRPLWLIHEVVASGGQSSSPPTHRS